MNSGKPALLIRDETAADIGAIRDVTAAAFEIVAISNQTEPYISAGNGRLSRGVFGGGELREKKGRSAGGSAAAKG